MAIGGAFHGDVILAYRYCKERQLLQDHVCELTLQRDKYMQEV